MIVNIIAVLLYGLGMINEAKQVELAEEYFGEQGLEISSWNKFILIAGWPVTTLAYAIAEFFDKDEEENE